MEVIEYLHWVKTASLQEKLQTTQDLAHRLLFQELQADEADVITSTLMRLTQDESLEVRQLLALILAPHENAPLALILALSEDVPEVACPIIAQSPLLEDAELLELLAHPCSEIHYALSQRASFSEKLLTRLLEVADENLCTLMVLDETLPLTPLMMIQLAKRFETVHEALLQHTHLPAEARYFIAVKRVENLQHLWPQERAKRLSAQEKERVALLLCESAEYKEAFMAMIYAQNNLTPAVLLRALYSGQFLFLEAALAFLSGVNLVKVSGILREKRLQGVPALFERAQLPATMLQSFCVGLTLWNEGAGGERPFACTNLNASLIHAAMPLLKNYNEPEAFALLRGFALEAAREEARHISTEMVYQPIQASPPVVEVKELTVLERYKQEIGTNGTIETRNYLGKQKATAPSTCLENILKDEEEDYLSPLEVPQAMNDDLSLLELYSLEKAA
jgi:uncharacterized protein (DUF2336 family)